MSADDIRELEDIFQSTLPARGSDEKWKEEQEPVGEFQSTLPARGSDLAAFLETIREIIFQSTLPARGSDQ